jgi:hypothetical protein
MTASDHLEQEWDEVMGDILNSTFLETVYRVLLY